MGLEKQKIRQDAVSKLNQISKSDREVAADKIKKLFFSKINIKQGDSVGLYAADATELSLHLLFKALIALHCKVSFPKVVGQELIFYSVESEHDLTVGKYGILEPLDKTPEVVFFDHLVVPGRAFDFKGNRVGRGKGFYDRFLLRGLHEKALGAAYDFQVHDCVPHEPHDLAVDGLLSEERYLVF